MSGKNKAFNTTGKKPPSIILTALFLKVFPTIKVKRLAIKVMVLPKNTSKIIQPVIRFESKHPTNKAGIASAKNSGKIVNASESLN